MNHDDEHGWDFELRIPGEPVPKGSYRVVTSKSTGKGMLIPQLSSAQRRWLRDAKKVAPPAPEHPPEGPFACDIIFTLARPASVSERKRPHPVVAPDLDKLVRNVLDVLKGVAFKDDSQVIWLSASKRYASVGESPSTEVRLARVEGP